MIHLTKIGGTGCFLNHALFELIEESPDTCITMSNGNRYLVLETAQQIRERIISWNVDILKRAGNIREIMLL